MKVTDLYHRTLIRIQLLFTRDTKKIKRLWIAYMLYSKQGRKKLAEAMVEPLRRTMFYG